MAKINNINLDEGEIDLMPFKNLFRKVYNKLDLHRRAKIINDFNPDFSFVIHFNAENYLDGQNDPVDKNFNTAFFLSQIVSNL